MIHLQSFEVQQLLHNKFVVILGDSVQRSVYKDLVLLLQKDCLLTSRQLKVKGELSFEQDKLMVGGQKATMHNGTSYREVREFCTNHHLVRFYFLTRVYSDYVQAILEELQTHEHTPDLVIINSCLWDISRYGQDSFNSYRKNLENMFRHLSQVLPEPCLLVWNTAMPVGKKITKAFLPPEQSSLSLGLKKKVIEANFYSFVEAQKHNFDVLDLHFHFRHAEVHRQGDGVHWDQLAHRHLSQLLLAHVADAWGVELPFRQPATPLIKSGRGQGVGRQSQASRNQRARHRPPSFSPPRQSPLLPLPAPHPPPPPPFPPPKHRPLLPLPAPHPPPRPLLSPQPLPFTRHPPRHPHPMSSPQDTYFTSDQPFQSGQFFLNYVNPDVSPSTKTGFDVEDGFRFDPQPPRVPFRTPYYQQQAPVVHRGFPRNRPRVPYAHWKHRPNLNRRQARAPYPEPRPH